MAEGGGHDVIVFGATGFTGGLTAEYLARPRPGEHELGAGGAQPGEARVNARPAGEHQPGVRGARRCSHADVEDPASLRELAESTKVVISTVGPYIRYGEPLVAACAAAGTDYVDLTGEPEFVDLCGCATTSRPRRSGARLVHSCGFDSIPYDLGALFTVEQLPEGRADLARGVRPGRGQLLRRHVPLGDPDHEPAARGPTGRARAPRARVAPDRPHGQGRPRQAAPQRLRRRLGGAVPDDRPPDRAPLRPGARPLRPRLLLQPLPRPEAAARSSSA